MGLMLPTGPTGWVCKTFTALVQYQRRDLKAARYHLDELAQSQDDLTEVLAILEHTLLQDTKFKKLIMEAMDAAATGDRIGPSFAMIWIREQAREQRWGSWQHFAAWIRRLQERAVAPIQQFLDLVSDAASAASCVPDLLNHHRDFIQPRTDLWAATGRAMVTSGMFQEAADWMKGAELRPDIRGWMLAIYLIALNALNRTREATEASLAAVRLGLRDDTWGLHVSQAGFGTAMGGDPQRARELLQLLPTHEVPPQWRMLHLLGDALSRVLALPKQEAKAVYKEQCTRLRELAKTLPEPTPALSAQYTQGIEAMAQHVGVGLWSWQRKYPKVGSGSTGRSFSFGGIPVVMIIIFATQALRFCDDSSTRRSSYSPAATQKSIEDSYRSMRELKEKRQQEQLQERLRLKMPTPNHPGPANSQGNSSANRPDADSYAIPVPPPPVPITPVTNDFDTWLEKKRQERNGNP